MSTNIADKTAFPQTTDNLTEQTTNQSSDDAAIRATPLNLAALLLGDENAPRTPSEDMINVCRLVYQTVTAETVRERAEFLLDLFDYRGGEGESNMSDRFFHFCVMAQAFFLMQPDSTVAIEDFLFLIRRGVDQASLDARSATDQPAAANVEAHN